MDIQKISCVNKTSQINTSPQNDILSRSTSLKSFRDVLSHAAESCDNQEDNLHLRFSKHAALRITSREINLTGEQIKRVEEGILRAQNKGISDSLVLVDEYALVVNTRSRTVITAMESRKKDDKIFTNIDGAVIV